MCRLFGLGGGGFAGWFGVVSCDGASTSRPPILVCGRAYLAFSPRFLWKNLSAGMPLLLGVPDSVSRLLAGGALLDACHCGGSPKPMHGPHRGAQIRKNGWGGQACV